MHAFRSWVRAHQCACYAQPREELMCFTHLVALAHDRNYHPPDHLRRSENLVGFPRISCSARTAPWRDCSRPTLTHSRLCTLLGSRDAETPHYPHEMLLCPRGDCLIIDGHNNISNMAVAGIT